MRFPRPNRLVALIAGVVVLFLIIAIILGGGDKAGDVGHAVLIETDFGKSSEPIVDALSGKPSPTFSGVIAEGWAENSSNWAEVRADCQVVEEEGQGFLRVNVSERQSGWAQFRHNLDGLKGLARYRVKVRLRNESADSVEMGVRMLGLPYQFYWEKKERFSDAWETYSYEFVLPRIKRDVSFFLVVRGEGTVDIASLMLERLEGQDEIVARLKREYPDEGPANIIRNSRFPLGLPTAWRLGGDFSERDADDVIIAADPFTIGPSGVSALGVKGTSVSLHSEPFAPIYPVVKHHVSLSVCGSGKWDFLIRSGKEDIDHESVRLKGNDTWQRISLTFDPELTGGLYSLRIQGGGQLWIDALQAGPKSRAGEYRSAGECEVALGLRESDASAARVQFVDEPARLLYCASGHLKDAVLKCKVVNAYGDEQPLADIKLTGDVIHRGELSYDVFPQRTYGSFRIEAWVERGGQTISPINETVVHRLRRPRYWGQDAPDSPFGAHFNSRRQRNITMKAIGVNWVRLHDAGITYIGWNYLEPEQGQWNFRDAEIHRYRRDHIKVFAQLGTVPPWARMQKGSHSAYHDMYSQPEYLADWQKYVRNVTQHYHGVIDTYFVWNEPWMRSRWNVAYDKQQAGTAGYVTSREPQKDYVGLMRASFEAARSVDENIRVCGFSTSDWQQGDDDGMIRGVEWTSGVLQHGGLQWCDVIDYHHYSPTVNGFAGDDVEQAWQRAIGPIVKEHGSVPKPVWMSEGQGSMETHHRGLYKHTLPGENGEDVIATSDRLVRHELSLLAAGVKKIFLYSPFAEGLGQKTRYATLVAGDGSLHPSAAAHSNLAWNLEDTEFVRRTEVADGVFAYLFQGADRSIAVLSSAPIHGQYTIPHADGVSVTDLFGNPLPPRSAFSGTLVYLSTREGLQAIDTLFAATNK